MKCDASSTHGMHVGLPHRGLVLEGDWREGEEEVHELHARSSYEQRAGANPSACRLSSSGERRSAHKEGSGGQSRPPPWFDFAAAFEIESARLSWTLSGNPVAICVHPKAICVHHLSSEFSIGDGTKIIPLRARPPRGYRLMLSQYHWVCEDM